MLVFLDESIRKHLRHNKPVGVLAGLAIPEDVFACIQTDLWHLRQPYHKDVLRPEDELKGTELLRKLTFEKRCSQGYSYHWNLAQEILEFSCSRHLYVFGIVCFQPLLHSFICKNETQMDMTFRYLFERIDMFMKTKYPNRKAKLIFDNRDHHTNEKNARAITNFFVRSPRGHSYDSIIRTPFFGVSQANNAGLQIADLITTIIALKFQGERRIQPLWEIVRKMFYQTTTDEMTQSSLKIIRNPIKKGPAA